MRTTIGHVMTIYDPGPELRQYVKDQLELPNPEYVKKERMGFWTGRTPKTLRLYEWNGNALVLPFGLCREVMPLIRGGEIRNLFTGGSDVDYGTPIPLYDYQRDAVAAMVTKTYGILKSPAGSGKTQCALAMIQAFGKKALWLCHTADLLKQSMGRAEMYMDEALMGTITEGKVNIGSGITFATVQTMCNIDLERYRHEWDVVVVDECHNVAMSASTVTRYQKVLNNLCARHKIGITATPYRSDGLEKALFALLGRVVYEVPDAAVADRVMTVTVKLVDTEAEMTDACLNVDGTIDFVKLITHLTTDPARNQLIADTIAAERGHSCIVLSDRLAQLDEIYRRLPEDLRERAAIINGKMTSKKDKAARQEAIEKMRTGELKVLLASYKLCREGLDVPVLDRLFMASPVKFVSVVIQSVGRIARTAEGKEPPVCYDFVDSRIGYCERAFKERKRSYRKVGAVIHE